MKQTFNIPDGCKTVSVEQVGNQIITSFEPEKYVPEKGDLVKVVSPALTNIFIFECAGINRDGEPLEAGDTIFNGSLEKKDHVGYPINATYTKLTPEEFQAEFDKLGYVYDFETHTARKKRKRVAVGKRYFYADELFQTQSYIEKRDEIDRNHFELGDYFETEEECQTYCDYMKECSLKYLDK